MYGEVLNPGALLNQIQLSLTPSSNSSDIKPNQGNQTLVLVANALKAGMQDTAKLVQQTTGVIDQIYSTLLAFGNAEVAEVELDQAIKMAVTVNALEASMTSTDRMNSQQKLDRFEIQRDWQKQSADMASRQIQKGQADFSKPAGSEAMLNGLWSGLGRDGYWRWKATNGKTDLKMQELSQAMQEENNITLSEDGRGDMSLHAWQKKKEDEHQKKEQQSKNEEEDELSAVKPDPQSFTQTLQNTLKGQIDLDEQTQTESESTLSAFGSNNNEFNQPLMNINGVQNGDQKSFTNIYEKVLYVFEMCRDWQLEIAGKLTDQMRQQTDFSKVLSGFEVYLNRMWSELEKDGHWAWRDKDGHIDPKMQEIINAMKKNGITVPEEGEGDMEIDKWLEKKIKEDEGQEGQEGRLGKADLLLLVKTISDASKRWADFSNQTQTKVGQAMNLYSAAQEAMTNTIRSWRDTLMSIARMMSG